MRWKPRAFDGVALGDVREAFRAFGPALRGQGWAIAGTFALAVAVTALELLKPWPIKVVFDRVLLPAGGEAGAWGLSPRATLAAAAVATLLIAVLLGALSVGATVVAARVGRKLTTRIRRQVFEHLHRLAIPFHHSNRTGDLLVRLMGDVNTIRDVLFTSWINLMSRGLLFVGTLAVLFVLDPWLGLLALYPLPLLAFHLVRASRSLREQSGKQRRREGDAAAFAAQTLRHIRVVKAYSAEEVATDRFARDSRSSERAGMRAVRIAAGMGRMTEVLSGAGLALVLFVGASWVLAGRVTAGELLVVMSYTRSLYKPLRGVSKEGVRLSKATACAARLTDVLRVSPEAREGAPVPALRGAIEVRDLRYTYAGGVRALRGVSFAVEPGEVVVIAGPNGSGKSTLISVLLRLLVPEHGEVLIDGRRIDELELGGYRRQFAYVPQETQLFGGTLRENVLYGRPDATDDQIERAVRDALLDPVVERLPMGLDTPLGENGATISGGEGRRLMLARAAVRDARVLILDEPLAGIDPGARRTVAAAIRRIAAGRTTLVVSHGPASEIAPDVVVQLAEGRVAAVKELGRPRRRAGGASVL